MSAGAGNPARRVVDVLYVSLGTTIGLRKADAQLVAALRAGGLAVEHVTAQPPRDVRTLALTDYVQARAAAKATRGALRAVDPRRVVYSTTTAALLWPTPGAIRFDALAQVTRPGRHGWWQRHVERRRLASAPLLIPCDRASLEGAPEKAHRGPTVVIPIAISVGDSAPSSLAEPTIDGGLAAIAPVPIDAEALRQVDALLDRATARGERPVAVTYAADARKKGLDRLLGAWALARRPGELLLVTGRDDIPEGFGPTDGVLATGRLDQVTFRALVRAVGVFITAPRREDYGLVQLEALAEGARVVTTAAPGPYAALPLVSELWPDHVVADDAGPAELAAAIRAAVDAEPDTEDLLRASAAVAPWKVSTVRETVARDLIPALLP
ncbi:MAG: glycosyltransferase [Solirubrobacteraceae bacterium]|nr:glycosyltransferase [Solirubrobacteraceae bacterium]